MRMFQNVLCVTIFAATVLSGCVSGASDSAQPETSVTDGVQEIGYIRSASDLERHLKSVSDSPLNLLPPAAKQRFIASLVFTSRGLASYEYVDLKALPAEHAAKILGLFHATKSDSGAGRTSIGEGVNPTDGHTTRGEFEGYVCKPADGGCVARQGHICNASTCQQA